MESSEIGDANSRARRMHQRIPKWHGQEQKTSFKNEDNQYAQVMEEIKEIKQELGKLKIDMAHVLKEKRHAETVFEASSSKTCTLSNSMAIITKEIEELDEEQVLVELARIEAIKESEAIEAQRTEEANRYQTQLENVKNKVKQIVQHNEIQMNSADKTPDLLAMVTEELETAKMELEAVRREGFNFMTSMDVIREELKHVQEQKARFEKEEEKRDLTVQNLNSQILNAKAKLEAVTIASEKANVVASNLSLTVEQLQAEAESAKKEKGLINEELENIRLEITKTESETEFAEKRLEVAMNELKAVKSSEFTALENLKNMIHSTVQARETASLNSPKIKITNFEYEYLTQKAGVAEEIANKKVAAAQAWVEALKANEKEILMKLEMSRKEIKELSPEIENDMAGGRRRSIDGELTRWAENGGKTAASPRKSFYKMGNMTPVKRARSQKLLSSATRHAIKSASFGKKREKAMQI